MGFLESLVEGPEFFLVCDVFVQVGKAAVVYGHLAVEVTVPVVLHQWMGCLPCLSDAEFQEFAEVSSGCVCIQYADKVSFIPI